MTSNIRVVISSPTSVVLTLAMRWQASTRRADAAPSRHLDSMLRRERAGALRQERRTLQIDTELAVAQKNVRIVGLGHAGTGPRSRVLARVAARLGDGASAIPRYTLASTSCAMQGRSEANVEPSGPGVSSISAGVTTTSVKSAPPLSVCFWPDVVPVVAQVHAFTRRRNGGDHEASTAGRERLGDEPVGIACAGAETLLTVEDEGAVALRDGRAGSSGLSALPRTRHFRGVRKQRSPLLPFAEEPRGGQEQ